MHLRKVDDAEKTKLTRNTLNRIEGVEAFLGDRAPSAWAVSEAGLYRLIMRADGAASKPFRDWRMGEA